MKLIVISSPDLIDKEAEIIEQLIQEDLQYYHLRKPQWDINMTRGFLKSLSADSLRKIILHDHYELYNEFEIKGCHRNFRNKDNLYGNSYSVSCHSFDELNLWKDKIEEYMFLSPIFNSISKHEYKSCFSNELLLEKAAERVINEKVIALGGIDATNISKINNYNFGGVAILGALWNEYRTDKNLENLIRRYKSLRTIIEKEK